MRLMVYSHDTFGLGNIRRMLAICSHLLANIPDLSILIVSGSPMLHSFRVHPGIDYIKLPCLKRTEQGDLGVRFLDLDLEQIVRLRRELILSTVVSFQPDVVLVDKKPDGLATELEPSLRYIRCNLPQTRLFLILRDILDAPEVTAAEWVKRGYQNTVQWYYDGVLVLGERRVFDVCAEYRFSRLLCHKVRYCGYAGGDGGRLPPHVNLCRCRGGALEEVPGAFVDGLRSGARPGASRRASRGRRVSKWYADAGVHRRHDELYECGGCRGLDGRLQHHL
jgi:predicted glycosyltransferase